MLGGGADPRRIRIVDRFGAAIDPLHVLTTGAERRLLRYQDRVIRECEATYDALAPDYDRHLQDECSYRSPERIAAALVPLDPQARWVDLGAGTGLVGEALHKVGCAPEMIAVDVSSAMLEQIVCPLYTERYQADVLSSLPLRPRSCAGAVAAGLMEYVLDVPALMHRVADVVAPGGAFVFTFVFARMADVSSGDIPYVLLHLAGLYDEMTSVPTRPAAPSISAVTSRSISPPSPCDGYVKSSSASKCTAV